VNLVEVLLGTGAAGAPALIGVGATTTYAELDDRSARLAAALVAEGVGVDDRVVITSANDEAFVVAYLAVLHVGAIAVPMNPMAPTAELTRELGAIEPTLALAGGAGAEMVRTSGVPVMTIDLTVLPPDPAPRAKREATDVAVLLFTSGTAGAPKAAMLTHGSLTANIRQVLDHPGLRVHATDVTFGALPFFHVFGLNVVLGVGLAAGASVALVDRFDAVATAELVRERRVTVLPGVPTMFTAWLDADLPREAFATVRLAVSGAAELPHDVAERFDERFGVVLHQGYGLTEASPIVTTTAVEDRPPGPGSIGPPLPGVEVRLVSDDGDEALAGDPGEIWVRGPNVFAGYWHDVMATERALGGDGWLHTGDVAVVDDEGALRLVDRSKDLVIVSGFNVFPVEVEDVLREHSGVADVAVVGAPSPKTGETVVAYVVAEPGVTLEPSELTATCARSLARYKCPTKFTFVDELPRAPSGKLLRRQLRP
jgi:long-chain acyl-CoA synthetase